MRPRQLIRCMLAALFIAAAAGCMRQPAPSERPQPIPSEAWLPGLTQRTDAWLTYQAKLNIRAESSKGTYHFPAVVLAQFPDRFRLEAFNLWGQTVAVLILNQEKSSLWVPSEKVLYTAEQSEALIRHFLGIPVPPETLARSLVASVPPDQLKGFEMFSDRSEWAGRSREPLKGLSLTYRFLPHPLTLQAIQVQEGPWNYTISYEPGVDMDPQNVPGQIHFSSSEWKLDVRVDQMRKATDIEPSAFTLPLPAGIRHVALDHAS